MLSRCGRPNSRSKALSTASASKASGRIPSLSLALLLVRRCEIPSTFCLASSLPRSDAGGGVEIRGDPVRDTCLGSTMACFGAVGNGVTRFSDRNVIADERQLPSRNRRKATTSNNSGGWYVGESAGVLDACCRPRTDRIERERRCFDNMGNARQEGRFYDKVLNVPQPP